MHDIEPHFGWRDLYIASEDDRSPFFRRRYSEFDYTHQLYNFYLHPQWDDFGSSTLYAKILFTDYEEGYTLIELIGEWNDVLHNDIMFLKRNIADVLMAEGVGKFVFFCDNVLNFHGLDDDYYAEWSEELSDLQGWVVLVNTRLHVENEMHDAHLDHFLYFGDQYNNVNWRPQKPALVFLLVERLLEQRTKRLI
jgi:hypothetical protein